MEIMTVFSPSGKTEKNEGKERRSCISKMIRSKERCLTHMAGRRHGKKKEYIGMVKSYYEGTQRSRQERPGEVAENSSGTAGIERPQAFARISVEVEDALKKICTRTMINKIIHGTMKGN
ncbi:hypothetical protein Tco_1416808 [Tanacetum coccineum]